MLSKEEIEKILYRIETICEEEICLFNKTIIDGNINQIKKYIEQLESENKQLKIAYKLMENEAMRDGAEEIKQLEPKANKYDSLVKKIKDKIKELKNQSGGNVFHAQQTINSNVRLLQELLKEVENE